MIDKCCDELDPTAIPQSPISIVPRKPPPFLEEGKCEGTPDLPCFSPLTSDRHAKPVLNILIWIYHLHMDERVIFHGNL
jgi:hypothetical protein